MLAILLVDAMGGPAPSGAEVDRCVQTMGDLLQRENFADVVEAAILCEKEAGHPRIDYFFGIAHLALGHPSLTIEALERYLANESKSEPEALRERARGRLEQAKEQAGRVLLRVLPTLPLDKVYITVRHERDEKPRSEKPIGTRETIDGRVAVWLDPGRSRITVRAAGFIPAERELEVAAGVHDVILDLTLGVRPPSQPSPRPEPRPEGVFPRRPWLIAAGATGGAFAVGGLVMLPTSGALAGQRLESQQDCVSDAGLDQCRQQLARLTGFRGVGAGLAGAGLAALAGGMTALLPRPGLRRTAWLVEAGVGIALAAAGVTSLTFGLRSFNAVNLDSSAGALRWEEAYRQEIAAHTRVYLLGAGLLGAGVGLGIAATVGLVVSQRFRSAKYAKRWQLAHEGIIVRF